MSVDNSLTLKTSTISPVSALRIMSAGPLITVGISEDYP